MWDLRKQSTVDIPTRRHTGLPSPDWTAAITGSCSWHAVRLRRLNEAEQVGIGKMRGLGRRATFVRHFMPEGPLLIEPIEP
jgi:hypothetical protein